MSRPLKLSLIALAGLVVLAAGFLWALPEIVRRVALDQIPKRTGRAAAIGDVDVNLFTGRLAIKAFRLAEREGPEPFVAFERLDVKISPLALLRSHVRVVEIALAAPSVRLVRTGPAEFNFSDLLGAAKTPESPPTPSRWAVTVERARISGGRVEAADRAVTPAADWLIQDLDFEIAGLTTAPGAPPGRLTLRLRLNESSVSLDAATLRLEPLQFHAKLAADPLDLRWLNPYVFEPQGTPYRPRGGRLALALVGDVDSDAEGVQKATLSGTISLEGDGLVQMGRPDPFVSASRLAVEVKEADLIARTLTIGSVAIETLDLKARRDARGVIDVVEIFTPRDSSARTPKDGAGATPLPRPPTPPTASPSTPAPPAGAAPPRRTLFPIVQGLAAGFQQIRVEQATLSPSSVLWIDERTRPTTRLALTKLQARLDGFTWPVRGPATLTLSTGLPAGGRLEIKGPMTVYPFDTELAMSIRDAPVAPYQGYIPIPARLSGRFNGDSKNRVAVRDGALVARSKGNSWATNVEIREPGGERPAIRVERMELVGIDFDWPRQAALVSAGFRRPRVEMERAADGSFNLRRMFTPLDAERGPSSPELVASRDAASPEAKPKGLLETMRLEFGKVRIEDGFIRFLDRTTQPAFSQDMSRLELTVADLGNRPDRRAKLTLQSVVGGDAGLDIRGEIGALGAPAWVDLVGELRNFKLPSVDPYTAANIGWVVRKGDLQYRLRFKLDGNQLAADNELVVGQLQVAPASASDEVKRRIGLPLGLIVALIKDQKGEIRANIPVTGAVNDPKVGLRDAIWTAVKNVLVNLVTAPFKAIGRMFSSEEKVDVPTVDPVTFAPGSAVVSPAMEEHLLRVGDFLRRAPFVSLSMAAVPTRTDVDALKDDAVAARLRAFRKERGLEDAAVALDAYFKERLPDVPVPPTVEERTALLRDRETVPSASLTDLARRRIEATRERLVAAEGIPAARLTVAETAPAASPGEVAGEGRVEFSVAARE